MTVSTFVRAIPRGGGGAEGATPPDMYDLLQNTEKKCWLSGLLWHACQENHIALTSVSTRIVLIIPPELAVATLKFLFNIVLVRKISIKYYAPEAKFS